MGNSVEPLKRRGRLRGVATVGLALLLVGFVAQLLAGPSAHASPGAADQFALADKKCTPPTNPYGSSTTIADCGTTTTVGEANVTLSISYNSGRIRWRACVSQSATGSTVQLYINGSPEDSSQVVGNGCTPNNNFALCLRAGRYNATAVDEPYGQASQVLEVRDSGCANPTVLSATSGLNGTGNGTARRAGGLAFTGADIALLVIAAAALMILGTVIVKMARQRR
ncbi:MAG TPA: hypothetical protein VFV02_03745, partial [Acidimicrobiales bacterium]|nr:hypothetical protein [Acidimicrobiales bacterium]